jgi:hypothetical protein
LNRSGLLLAAWYENRPSGASRSNEIATYLDREPYHYDYDLVSQVCGMVGFRVERLERETSPSGESVFLLTPV